MENNFVNFKIEDVILLLDSCLSENRLNEIICTTEDISLLYISLEVKHYYILHGLQKKLSFSIDKLFEDISFEDCELKFKVLKLCILVQNIDSITLVLINNIEKLQKNAQRHLVFEIKLLNVVADVCYSLNLPFSKLIKDDLINNMYVEIYNSHTKLLQNLFCEFLFKYAKFGGNLDFILSSIITLNDLYTASCCIDCFIKFGNIIEYENFWLMVGDNLQISEYNKKLSLYILKKYIEHVNKSGNFLKQPKIIKGSVTTELDFPKTWNNYLNLIDISQEKHLHLLIPALNLIPKINSLHFLWKSSLYKILLSHVQNVVVFNVLNHIFQSELVITSTEEFHNIVKCFLPALNVIDYAENFTPTYENLRTALTKLNNQYFTILLDESLNINFSPVAAWYFYSNVFTFECNKDISVDIITNMLNRVKNLPHTFIRYGCYVILIKYLSKYQASTLSLNGFVILANELQKCDTKLLPLLYQYATDNIHKYNKNGDVKSEILTFRNRNIENIEIFLDILEVNKENFALISNLITSNFFDKEIEDYFYNYLCKCVSEQLDAADFLLKRLPVLTSNSNMIYLYKVANFTKYNSSYNFKILFTKCKAIILNPSKYEEEKISLAFIIYSNNIDHEIGDVIKLWNKKLLNREKISDTVFKFYAKLYLRYLKDTHDFEDVSIPQTILQIIDVIFDTQTEATWINLYENFDVILQHVHDKELLQILERYFNEILKITNTKILLHMWELLLPQIFTTERIFTNENIKSNLINRIRKICLTNDSTAYIFINQLLKCKEINILLHFFDLIVDLMLYGNIYKKNRRCEYYACSSIDTLFKRKSDDNPIYLENNIRCVAINVMLDILNSNKKHIIERLTKLLLDKYSKNNKRRYFPDSEIHLLKLRIIQSLIVVVPYTSDQEKIIIINMIINSFCEESHQPCVKQLMQFLLVLLLSERDDCLTQISEAMDNASRTHVSTIVAFVPVLCHLGFRQNEEFIEKLIKVILEWTMGAHFKLRLYAQVAILKLIEASLERNYTNIWNKYKDLYSSIKKVLEYTGINVYMVLQSDQEFIGNFDIKDYYNLQTIFLTIPKLNNAPETEWRHINLDLISNNILIPTRGVSFRTDRHSNKKNDIANDVTECAVNTDNLQKKILPWKELEISDNDNRKENGTELILVASLIDSPSNLGGLCRTSEIYKVKKLVISDGKIVKDKEFKSLSMSSEQWVNIIEVKSNDLPNYLQKKKNLGYVIIGAEQTSESVALHSYKFPKRCVLVLGNEKEGIPPYILPFLDICVEIAQFGVVRSLNVHVAGAILIWEYTKQNTLFHSK